jgi:ATP-binding cassette subfamily F protein uup
LPPALCRLAAAEEQAKRAAKAAASSGGGGMAAKPVRKLSNKERAELEALPKTIETLEGEQTTLTATLGDPLFFKKPGGEVAKATAKLEDVERLLAVAYARWEELC